MSGFIGKTAQAIAVTNASAATAITATDKGAYAHIVNTGTTNVFFTFGTDAAVATVGSYAIAGGTDQLRLMPSSSTHIAAIAAVAGTITVETGDWTR